ncbi:hypothetical protein HN858_02345 [Candidatus Falkowbacteria bacterium]|jgi:hypothetical protein|nr:hypothetical protein [Candidatus Falkowbacteria bacterium]MBT5503196.1 hypothetical protein [Candidatus Falkowbacteria bacterium]MBT6573897.1 hypothetical protein [Candidatus Falkowbacteria bacterium]MBT7348496.1 hypothetical protein [Candidatus Falkowbacteria bacterium]MBT7500839.1 hypothetical protein [Candidatus Falkowbacteria bacterium]
MEKKFKSQQGNVLIYSLLTIAAILSSTIVLSNLVRSSIVQTGLITTAQSAFYNAESGIEKALYSIRKLDRLPMAGDCNVDDIDCDLDVDSEAVKELKLDLPTNQTVQFDLFTPEKNTQTSQIESVYFDWQGSTTWLEVSIIKWPNNFVFKWPVLPLDWELEDLAVQKFLYSGGQPSNSALNNYISSSGNYRVRVKALYSTADNLTIKLYSLDNASGQSKAFPNTLSIEALGKQGQASHRLMVDMPRYSPTLGLFDYVLFSESVIKK